MLKIGEKLKFLVQILSGFIGLVLGLLSVFLINLLTGDGIQFNSLFGFLIPLILGGFFGFCLGFIFYKVSLRLFNFLTNMSVNF